ncbi:hypothetical protein EV361DRAFT_865616 [Lentinula raphanica]|nr:hypothetical protein F5880DRAFT_1508176 [Lentinula raphanica]KAJ3975133.1 hypothetical protein EV361DRAFT_865616 [Lentinula raphanica]
MSQHHTDSQSFGIEGPQRASPTTHFDVTFFEKVGGKPDTVHPSQMAGNKREPSASVSCRSTSTENGGRTILPTVARNAEVEREDSVMNPDISLWLPIISFAGDKRVETRVIE